MHAVHQPPHAARTVGPMTSGLQMPSTTIRRSATADHVVIDDEPTLEHAMQAIVACRASERPVPAHLLNSMRAYRLSTLADAIDRYNERLERRLAATA